MFVRGDQSEEGWLKGEELKDELGGHTRVRFCYLNCESCKTALGKFRNKNVEQKRERST